MEISSNTHILQKLIDYRVLLDCGDDPEWDGYAKRDHDPCQVQNQCWNQVVCELPKNGPM